MSLRLSCKRLILFSDLLPPPFAHVKEQLYPPSWVQGLHVHEHTHCCYVTSGRVRLTLPKEDRIVEAGDMILIRAGVAHGWKGIPFMFDVEVGDQSVSLLPSNTMYVGRLFTKNVCGIWLSGTAVATRSASLSKSPRAHPPTTANDGFCLRLIGLKST